MNVARSVVEEKTSRVFEVLLSTAGRSRMMAGKLLGVGAAGLTQMGIWFVAVPWCYGRVTRRRRWAKTGIWRHLESRGREADSSSWFISCWAFCFIARWRRASAATREHGAGDRSSVSMIIVDAALPGGAICMTVILDRSDGDSGRCCCRSFRRCTPVVMYLRMASQMPPVVAAGLSIVCC